MSLLMMKKKLFAAAGALCLAATTAATAQAQVVQVVVPFPAGGPLDSLARIVTAQLAGPGESYVVDNRAGANGMIGAKFAAAAAPDGKTWLMADGALISVNPRLYPKDPNFNVERDLTPVAGLVFQPSILVVNANSPWKTMREFIAAAKARPMNYASGGIGSTGHLTMELFASAAGISPSHVPYKGGAPAMNDLLGGQVDAAFVSVGGAIGHVRSGKLRALAVSGTERLPAAPDVPTAAEAGLPGFQVQGAYFVLVPSKTPADAMRAISEKAIRAVNDPQAQEKLRAIGMDPKPMTMDEAARWIAADKARMAKTIAEKNIKAE